MVEARQDSFCGVSNSERNAEPTQTGVNVSSETAAYDTPKATLQLSLSRQLVLDVGQLVALLRHSRAPSLAHTNTQSALEIPSWNEQKLSGALSFRATFPLTGGLSRPRLTWAWTGTLELCTSYALVLVCCLPTFAPLKPGPAEGNHRRARERTAATTTTRT